MFASERQRARVCQALCRSVRLKGMWTDQGPSALAVNLLNRDGGPLSTGERIMFLAAWNVWSGEGSVNLGDVIHRLDNKNLRALGSLMIAVVRQPNGVDQWLLQMERESDPSNTVNSN
jgi:hypothetical protein